MSVASFLDEDAFLNDHASDINISKEDELALIGATPDLLKNSSLLLDESTSHINPLSCEKIVDSESVAALVTEQSEPTTSNNVTSTLPNIEQSNPEPQSTENDSDVEMVEVTAPDSVHSLKRKLFSYEQGMRELRTKLRRERAQHRETCSNYEARITELQKMLGGQTNQVVPKSEIKEEPHEEPVEQMAEDPPTVPPVAVDIPLVEKQSDKKTRHATRETRRETSERFTKTRQRRSSSTSSDKEIRKSRETRRPNTEAKQISSRSSRRDDKTEKSKEVPFGPNFYSAVYNPPKEADKENKKSSRREEDKQKSSKRPEREKKEIKVEWMHVKECRFNCRNCGFDNDVMKREMLLRALDRDKSTAPDYVKNTNSWISVEDRWFFCKSCDLKVEAVSTEDIEKKKKLLEERRDKQERNTDRYSDRRRRRSRSPIRGTRTNTRLDRKRVHSQDSTSNVEVKRQMSRLETQRAVDQHLKRTVDFEKGSLRPTEDLTFEQKEALAMTTLKALAYEPRMMLICGLGHELPPLLEEMSQDPKTGHPWRKMKRDRLATKEVLDTYSIEKREALKAQYNIKEPLAEHIIHPELAQMNSNRLDSWFEDFENEAGPSTSRESRSVSSEGQDEISLSD